MKTALIVGGPLILIVTTIVFIGSGIISFGDAAGLDMELTEESIEYRDGSEPTHVRKMDGLKKFGNITLKWPIHYDDIDLAFWRWTIEGSDTTVKTHLQTETTVVPAGVEMKQIDPPVLVIPAGPTNGN